MRFSIITPTHKRREKLNKAVESVKNQTYRDWEMIIVNDSPADDSYRDFASTINDPRISYHSNVTNKGVNYSRNLALDKLSSDSKWLIFLDDDDYLAPDALQTFHDLIMQNPHHRWFVTNRAYQDGAPTTSFPKDNTYYSYAWSYLILKRCKGDATHCIETKLITSHNARFSRYIKQGEEWFFFYQIGIHSTMFYNDHNSTITDGYDITSGLNFRERSTEERSKTFLKLLYEARQKHILLSPPLWCYFFLRFFLIFLKRN